MEKKLNKDQQITIRLDKPTKALWTLLAAEKGLDIGVYIRMLAMTHPDLLKSISGFAGVKGAGNNFPPKKRSKHGKQKK